VAEAARVGHDGGQRVGEQSKLGGNGNVVGGDEWRIERVTHRVVALPKRTRSRIRMLLMPAAEMLFGSGGAMGAGHHPCPSVSRLSALVSV
jgi:hypothetical protein